MEEAKTYSPRCNWLLVGHKKTCQRAATQSGYCNYHNCQNITPTPCNYRSKGTRSTVNVCTDKNYNYQKLRYKKEKEDKEVEFRDFLKNKCLKYFSSEDSFQRFYKKFGKYSDNDYEDENCFYNALHGKNIKKSRVIPASY